MYGSVKGQRGRLAAVAVCAGAALSVLLAAPSAWPQASTKKPTAPSLKVQAQIRLWGQQQHFGQVTIFFKPAVVNVGWVTIVARNYDDVEGHFLSINGVTSKYMGPGRGAAVLKVHFKRPGVYTASALVDGSQVGGSGTLKVVR